MPQATGHSMVLCFFTHAETSKITAPSRTDGGDSIGHGIRTHGQSTDRRGMRRNDRQRDIGNEHDSIGSTSRLFGVEKP